MLNRLFRKRWIVCPPLLLTFICSLAWFPRVALPQTAGGSSSIVLVIPPGYTSDVPASVANTIEQNMKALLGIDSKLSLLFSDVRDPGAGFELPAAPQPPAEATLKPIPENPKLKQVLASLDKARELVQKKSWESALSRLMTIKNSLSGMVADTPDISALIEAHELIAVAFISGGYNEEGASAMKALLTINPDYTGANRSERVQAAAARNRDRLADGGVLNIRVKPDDAVVYVDGRLIGSGSQTITGLKRGKHFVRVTGETSFPAGGSVTVDAAGNSTSVSYSLKSRVEQPKPVAAPVIKAGPRPLIWYAKTGLYDQPAFPSDVKNEASAVFADHVLFMFYARSEDRFHVGAFVASGLTGTLTAVEPAVVNLDLGNLYVELLGLETRIQKVVADPSTGTVVTAQPPIYRMVQAKPKPVPVAVPEPAPAPTQPTPVASPTPAPAPAPAGQPVAPAPSGVPEDFPMDIPSDFPVDDGGYAQPAGTQYVTEEVVDTKEEKPVYKQWWLWTIVGIVVAGAAAGTAAGVILSDDSASTVNGGISW